MLALALLPAAVPLVALLLLDVLLEPPPRLALLLLAWLLLAWLLLLARRLCAWPPASVVIKKWSMDMTCTVYVSPHCIPCPCPCAVDCSEHSSVLQCGVKDALPGAAPTCTGAWVGGAHHTWTSGSCEHNMSSWAVTEPLQQLVA
jgi:hypothetical protein